MSQCLLHGYNKEAFCFRNCTPRVMHHCFTQIDTLKVRNNRSAVSGTMLGAQCSVCISNETTPSLPFFSVHFCRPLQNSFKWEHRVPVAITLNTRCYGWKWPAFLSIVLLVVYSLKRGKQVSSRWRLHRNLFTPDLLQQWKQPDRKICHVRQQQESWEINNCANTRSASSSLWPSSSSRWDSRHCLAKIVRFMAGYVTRHSISWKFMANHVTLHF